MFVNFYSRDRINNKDKIIYMYINLCIKQYNIKYKNI